MDRKSRLANFFDRALLGAMMFCIAFVLEKALDRMVEAKPDEAPARSRFGRGLIQRMMPGMSANLQHQHSRTGNRS